MIKVVEGLDYYGVPVVAEVELQDTMSDTWVISAYFEETGIYLTDLECLDLREHNRARINAIRKGVVYERE